MGILAEVIKFKQQEDQKSLLDIAAIGDSVENFINIRQNQKRQERQSRIDELNRRNILSQIEAREKVDPLEDVQIRNIESQIQARIPTELEKRNIESQIKAREPSVLDELLERGKAFEAAAIIADQTNDTSLLDTLRRGTNDLNDFLSPDPSGDITPVDRSLPQKETQASDLGVGLERTPSGKLTEVGKIQLGLQEKKAVAGITTGKEVASQKSKAQEKTERDTTRASLVSDTAFQEVVEADAQIFEKFGLKPGSYFGLFAKIIPKQLINNKAAALGAGREAAATVGMSIIPAARAVRMVEIFAKSSAELGNTIEGNAANVAASMGNTFARRISDNIPIELKIGGTLPMQEITRDPLTGKMISEFFDFGEKVSAMNRVKNEFRDELEKEYIMQVFNNNPDLLQSKTIKEILDSLSPEEIKQMLGE